MEVITIKSDNENLKELENGDCETFKNFEEYKKAKAKEWIRESEEIEKLYKEGKIKSYSCPKKMHEDIFNEI